MARGLRSRHSGPACRKPKTKSDPIFLELKKIEIPVVVPVGDRDPVKRLDVAPPRQAWNDWEVVEIPGAGHIHCILKPRFRDEIGAWVRRNSK